MYADQIDNDVRREIFLKLCQAESLRYSDLKPKEMESNHFAYHLKKLKDDGFIMQDDENSSYTLAPKGLRLADILSFKTDLIRTQPKIVVLVIAMSSDGKRVLSGIRKRQPHFGKKVLPAGKLHFGETLDAAVNRTLGELLPEADVADLIGVGNASIIYMKGEICVSHIYAHLYKIKLSSTDQERLPLGFDKQSSELYWEEIVKMGKGEEWLTGATEIFEKSEQSDSEDLELVIKE